MVDPPLPRRDSRRERGHPDHAPRPDPPLLGRRQSVISRHSLPDSRRLRLRGFNLEVVNSLLCRMPCSIPPPGALSLEGGGTLAKFRNSGLAALVIVSTLAASFPAHADTAGRPDDPVPDEIYYGIQGPAYAEDKGGGGAPMAAPSAAPAGPLGSPLTGV